MLILTRLMMMTMMTTFKSVCWRDTVVMFRRRGVRFFPVAEFSTYLFRCLEGEFSTYLGLRLAPLRRLFAINLLAQPCRQHHYCNPINYICTVEIFRFLTIIIIHHDDDGSDFGPLATYMWLPRYVLHTTSHVLFKSASSSDPKCFYRIYDMTQDIRHQIPENNPKINLTRSY